MPNWKKVITSGSDASFNSVHVSNAVTASIFTGSFVGDGSGLTNLLYGDFATGSFSAQSTWLFTHNLGYPYVAVEVYDQDNFVVIPSSIKIVDNDSVEIQFTSPQSGTVLATLGTGIISSSNTSATFPFTGSALITGSLEVTGSITSTTGFTGSLFGTSSWAENALTSSFITASNVYGPHGTDSVISSSYAVSASYLIDGITIDTSSLVTTSSFNSFTSSIQPQVDSLISATSSYITNSVTASMSVLNAETASFVTGSNVIGTVSSSSFATSASFATSSSYSDTASFINTLNQDVTITGSLTITNNLTVLGSSSIQYITSSQLNIEDNIISVNTITPAIRFGGLSVIDSGSTPQQSGSLLFDSQNNQWIFVHQNAPGSDITSSLLLMGPQTFNNVGNETALTTNRLPKASSADLGEHLTDSNITDNGSVVSINSNTQITGSLVMHNGAITGSLTGSVVGALTGTASFASVAAFALSTTPAASGPIGIANSSGVYTFYTNLTDAMAAATSGQIIELFADITETGNVSIGLKQGVDINGNGHTYTYTNNSGTMFTYILGGGTITTTINLLNLNIVRTNGASTGAPIFGSFTNTSGISNTTLNFINSTATYTATSGNTPIVDATAVLHVVTVNGLTCTTNGAGTTIACSSANFCTITCNGTSNGYSGGTINNSRITTTSGNGVEASSATFCTIRCTTSGIGVREGSASDTTITTNTGNCMQSGQSITQGTAVRCNVSSTSGQCFRRVITTNCIGTTGANTAVDLWFNYNDNTAKFYRNYFSTNSTVPVVINGTAGTFELVDTTIIQNGTGPGVRLFGAVNQDIINCTFIMGSTSANCITAAATTNARLINNKFKGATIPISTNVVQQVVNTMDNQGNILL